jgi:hypothetical protein
LSRKILARRRRDVNKNKIFAQVVPSIYPNFILYLLSLLFALFHKKEKPFDTGGGQKAFTF